MTALSSRPLVWTRRHLLQQALGGVAGWATWQGCLCATARWPSTAPQRGR
jgi:hypothetical protein